MADALRLGDEAGRVASSFCRATRLLCAGEHPMNVFLDGPKRFENLCAIARTMEILGFDRCLVHDPHRLVRDRYGKGRRRVAMAVSAGAFHRVAFERIEDPGSYLMALTGRVVVTVPDARSVALPDFSFRPGDTVVFGAETYGISGEVLAQADERVTVPQRGVTGSLNLAVSVGIVLYEAVRQLGPDAFDLAP